jgi:hypothetical protein
MPLRVQTLQMRQGPLGSADLLTLLADGGYDLWLARRIRLAA